MGRHVLENFSKSNARLIDRTDDWLYCRILGAFDMYAMNGDASLTPHLVQEGFWESWITEWVTKNVKPGDTFFDIGANAGYYTFLANHLGANVAAFEPIPKFAEMMNATIRRRGLKGIKVHNYALSDRTGMATLNVPQYLQGSASLGHIDEEHKPYKIAAQTYPLDSFISMAQPGVRYIFKIDAEGHEEKIWDGMTKWLKHYHPTVFLEYTPGAYSKDFIDRLNRYGRLQWINGNGDAEPVDRQWIESQNDWVMLLLEKR